MRRSELEHLIRAAGAVTNEDQLVIIGSQSILASFPDAAPELLQSMEADIIRSRTPKSGIYWTARWAKVRLFTRHKDGQTSQGLETATHPH